MKTLKQMQDELIAQAKWDGGWHRLVIMGPGVIKLCRNQKDYDRSIRFSLVVHSIYAIGLLIATALVICGFVSLLISDLGFKA